MILLVLPVMKSKVYIDPKKNATFLFFVFYIEIHKTQKTSCHLSNN
jgi:hypothetical protein